MDVEAVLNDGRQFDLKRVVINRVIPRDIDLQRRWLCPRQIADRNGSQPQCADNFLKMRSNAGLVWYRLRHGNDVLLRFCPQGPVMLIRYRVQQSSDAGCVVI